MNMFADMIYRRSVNFFREDVEISERDLEDILDLAALAPSGSNTQPWEVVAVKESEAKKRLRECAFDQPKVTDASVTLIIVADPEAYKGDNPAYQSFVRKGYMDEEGLKNFVKQVEGIYSGLEKPDRYAVKNASLFAMSLMYAAQGFGWDTHPMIGFNPDDVKKEFSIPEEKIIPMLISLGKFDDSKNLLPRNDRKSARDFVSYDKYTDKTAPEFDNQFVETEDRTVKMEDQKLHLDGRRLKEGAKAPEFKVLNNEVEEVTLAELLDKPLIVSVVPSLDTPVCSIQTKKFNEKLKELEDNYNFATISCDTPFAQGRFCSENALTAAIYSDIKGKEFSLNYGVLVRELGLAARSVFIIETDRTIRYIQIVENLGEEPDYDDVMQQLI